MRQINPERMYSFRSGSIKFESIEEIPWTLDGEFGGVHDSVVVTNKKKALDIMVKEEAVADISSESGREDELPAAGSTHGSEL